MKSINNGKHVRSHSLRHFPALSGVGGGGGATAAAQTVTANCHNNNKKPPSDDDAVVGGAADPQTTNAAVKMTSTWKQACDRTRDRTKQLLRRTMSWKSNAMIMQPEEPKLNDTSSTWEIHVWASWMKRYASEDESKKSDVPFELSPLQEEKLLIFFKHYLDGDCDGFVFEHDFHQFSEKLRRFADWSPSSDEYIILKQVLNELIQVFIPCESGQNVAFISLSTDDWLKIWCQTLSRCAVASDMPLWLKYFQNILFKSLDSGKGVIEKENLQRFYLTFLDSNCEEAKQVVIDAIYNSLTSNGDFKLNRDTWAHCFANWLLGTKPNGSGQWLFGKCGPTPEFFPIDYSAMNSTVDTRDTYSHKIRSDRHSIVV